VLGRTDCLHDWIYARCREVEAAPDDHIDIWAREHYKALDVKTPVWTPHGWLEHGELKPGCLVYAPDGRKVKVLANTGPMLGADCFQVGEVLAAGDHLWPHQRKRRTRVASSQCRKISYRTEIKRTADVQSLCLNFSEPLEGTPLDPRVPHPYVLGAWLGDGSTGSTRITQSAADAPEMEAILRTCGARVSSQRHSNAVMLRIGTGQKGDRGSSDFSTALKKLGIYRSKAVPHAYLVAPPQERLALLQGMMDTDGTVDKRGTATFVNVNESLADALALLVRSLGFRASKRRHTVLYKGKRRPFFQVSFQAYQGRWCPFRLARKAARCLTGERTRRLFSPVPVPSVPVNCIQVEGGLYLAGEQLLPTHNSTIITFAGIIQEILRNPEQTTAVFSHTKAIAEKFVSQIKLELERNLLLRAAFPDILYENPARESERWSVQKGLVVKRKSNPKEGTLEAWGLIDGTPVGAHFMLRVYDDVVVPASVNTPDQIMKTTEGWSMSSNLGAAGGRVWYIGTRYHFADTYQEIMNRKAAIPRIYPATDNGQKDGNPVLFSEREWDKRKLNMLDSTLACQMLQNPLAGSQRMFNTADLQVYEVRPRTLQCYLLCDPARSKKKTSANTAMVVIGIDAAGNKYLLDGYDHKMDLMERWLRFSELYDKWSREPGVVGIIAGYESFGARADLDYFQERQRLEANHFEIIELEWPESGEVGKDDRVQRLVPDIRGKRFYLPYPTDEERLTRLQRSMVGAGYDYRVARPIRRLDEEDRIYDVAERLRIQMSLYPFGGRKDLIDATSRIYDAHPIAPEAVDQRSLEPDDV